MKRPGAESHSSYSGLLVQGTANTPAARAFIISGFITFVNYYQDSSMNPDDTEHQRAAFFMCDAPYSDSFMNPDDTEHQRAAFFMCDAHYPDSFMNPDNCNIPVRNTYI